MSTQKNDIKKTFSREARFLYQLQKVDIKKGKNRRYGRK